MNDTLKYTSDLAIANFLLEGVFYDIFKECLKLKTEDKTLIKNLFYHYSALFLYENYRISIPSYLDNTELSKNNFINLNELNLIKLEIDEKFQEYIISLKHQDKSNKDFFKLFHRRDIKQSSMLRSFIIVKMRLDMAYWGNIGYVISKVLLNPFDLSTNCPVLKIFFNPWCITDLNNNSDKLKKFTERNLTTIVNYFCLSNTSLTTKIENNSSPLVLSDLRNVNFNKMLKSSSNIFQINYFPTDIPSS